MKTSLNQSKKPNSNFNSSFLKIALTVGFFVCGIFVVINVVYNQNKLLAEKQQRWKKLIEERNIMINQFQQRQNKLANELKTLKEIKSTYRSIIPKEKLNLKPYFPNPKHAIVTMIGEAAWWHPYWLGAVALVKSLREVDTRVPNIIILCRTPLNQVPSHALRSFESLGAILVPIPDIVKADFINIPGVWSAAWTKLKIWQWTQYEKILFMDADTLAVDNLDHLLNEPELSAPWTPMACWCLDHIPFKKGSEYYTLSSGFFVMSPNETMYEHMMDLASKPSPDPWDKDQFGGNWHWGDQEMLRVVFSQLTDNWSPLPNQQYDTNIGLCDCEDRRTTSRSYHFTCTYPVPKPWGDVFKSLFHYPTHCSRKILLLWQRFLTQGIVRSEFGARI